MSNLPNALEFDFEEDDRVLVRVREHGDSGNIKAKFEADVSGFREGLTPVSAPKVCLNPPWDQRGTVDLKAYEAEFEVLDDAE